MELVASEYMLAYAFLLYQAVLLQEKIDLEIFTPIDHRGEGSPRSRVKLWQPLIKMQTHVLYVENNPFQAQYRDVRKDGKKDSDYTIVEKARN